MCVVVQFLDISVGNVNNIFVLNDHVITKILFEFADSMATEGIIFDNVP